MSESKIQVSFKLPNGTQAGEIYKSYMCPAPKGALDKCKSISLRKGTPEWEAFVPDKLAK